MKILAVTACPVGIAHTYMAAENLQKAAEKKGVQIKVETQGSVGAENVLTEAEIEEADGIIIASDKSIDKSRFTGKQIVEVGVQEGIRKSEQLIDQIKEGKGKVFQGDKTTTKKSSSKQNPVYKHLMNGVSFMIPFIVVGGLLVAIAVSLGGDATSEGLQVAEGTIWAHLEAIGGASFSFMIPILAGFIAMSIADRPGLAPGMIGGLIAADGSFYGAEEGAGFIGGIIAGFLAGYVALAIKKVNVPKAIQPIMPIIIIPILASLIVGLLFIFVIGAPVATVFDGLTAWLASMEGTSSILLAIILGAMISFDMGGPVNKVAFLFGAAMIVEGNFQIMGPIAAAICIPPIGLGIATFLNNKKFEKPEIEAGKASFTMGIFGITEGAIPFAAKDPLRVIPSIMVGSIVGAVIAMAAGVGNTVAHGGPIVAVLGAVSNVAMFFVAVIIGSFVVALLVNFLKKNVDDENEESDEAPQDINSDKIEKGKDKKETDEEAEVAKSKDDGGKKKAFTQLTDIINHDLISMNLEGDSRDDIIEEMIDKLDKEGKIDSSETYFKAVLAREAESSTGLGMNIAIPHAKSNAVKEPAVVFGKKKSGVDWSSLDGTEAKLIFMIAVPEKHEGNEHLKILQMLSRKLMDEEFRQALLAADSKDQAYALLEEIK